MKERAFKRVIGIDYSGADTAIKGLGNLAVYSVEGNGPPHRVVLCIDGTRRRWTREKIAQWLIKQLKEGDQPTLVGIDHAFSFPERYFKKYPKAMGDWDTFLDDFCKHWPIWRKEADKGKEWLKIEEAKKGNGRLGKPGWKRLTDECTPSAKSVFDFAVKQGNVAKSTHAGIPWLRCIRRQLRESKAKVHFWPFDNWDIPEGTSVVAEVYPALWKGLFGPRPEKDMTRDQYDAYIIASWLSWVNQKGLLGYYLRPHLSPKECKQAKVEGWILGSLGLNRLGVGKEVSVKTLQAS